MKDCLRMSCAYSRNLFRPSGIFVLSDPPTFHGDLHLSAIYFLEAHTRTRTHQHLHSPRGHSGTLGDLTNQTPWLSECPEARSSQYFPQHSQFAASLHDDENVFFCITVRMFFEKLLCTILSEIQDLDGLLYLSSMSFQTCTEFGCWRFLLNAYNATMHLFLSGESI